MPMAAPSVCIRPGCGGRLPSGGVCDRCGAGGGEAERKRRFDQGRGTTAERGYGGRWQRARLRHLQREPLCRAHQARGQTVAATEVDHIVPHHGDPTLFWDETNWQSLCKSCHSAKTATEDSPFALRPE